MHDCVSLTNRFMHDPSSGHPGRRQDHAACPQIEGVARPFACVNMQGGVAADHAEHFVVPVAPEWEFARCAFPDATFQLILRPQRRTGLVRVAGDDHWSTRRRAELRGVRDREVGRLGG